MKIEKILRPTLGCLLMLLALASTGCFRHANRNDSDQGIRTSVTPDVQFAYGGYDATAILPNGREEVSRIAGKLRSGNGRVRVIGHTDDIGSERANLTLSQRRAETVRLLLIDGGVAAERITAEGRGDAEPLKQCDPSLPRDTLIDCLQSNRRVEIKADSAA